FVSQADDGIRARNVTGVQTCALPIFTEYHKEYGRRNSRRDNIRYRLGKEDVFYAKNRRDQKYSPEKYHFTECGQGDCRSGRAKSDRKSVGQGRRAAKDTCCTDTRRSH